MARNQGLLEEGRERFEGALKDMERDWKRLQKRADNGRKHGAWHGFLLKNVFCTAKKSLASRSRTSNRAE